MERHCNHCKYSYQAINFNNEPIGQHCNNTKYNSEDYTHEMLMEDWGKGSCRYFESKVPVCPMCQKEFTGYPALSRKDNQTEICPTCGIKEAMESFNVVKEGDLYGISL